MQNIIDFIETKIAPFANKLSNNKYITALQNAFLTLIPFFTLGSFALIIISPPLDYTTLSDGFLKSFFSGWSTLAAFSAPTLGAVYVATMGSMSLYVAAGLGYYLGKIYDLNRFISIGLALASFVIVAIAGPEGQLVTQYLDGTGLFTSIVVPILTIEIYRFLVNKQVGNIQLQGEGVPEALKDSIATLIPISIVVLIIAIANSIIFQMTGVAFPEVITQLLAPIVGAVDSVWGVLFLAAIVMLFWWFGIHDTVITGPLSPFLVANLAANAAAYAGGTSGDELPHILTINFWWTFMAIGGSGATLGLACLAAISKSKQIRTIGRLSIVPAFFNINEPLIFGLPIMFNSLLLIPFMIVMPLNGVITYLFMDFGIVGRTFADGGWNMFAPIGALISTLDINALFLTLGLIILDIFIYLPFFKAYEKKKIFEEQNEELIMEEVAN